MSGGHWDYIQYRFSQVIEDITDAIENSGKKKDLRILDEWDRQWIKSHPDAAYNHKHPDEVIQKFKEARLCIAEAQEHMQRLDWLFSDDDGEESYLDRLEENLKEIRKKYKVKKI